jgi:hypothetical protein
MGETCRPKSRAASTRGATTPARMAEGGALATRMYSQIRVSVAGMRRIVGTAKARGTKQITAASTEMCCPEIARTCVIVPLCTESRFHFSVRLDDKTTELRFERAVAG